MELEYYLTHKKNEVLMTKKIREISASEVCYIEPQDSQNEFSFKNSVWKFKNFSATQILREINFMDSRSAKLPFLAFLRAVDFFHLLNFSLQKVQDFIKIKIQSL